MYRESLMNPKSQREVPINGSINCTCFSDDVVDSAPATRFIARLIELLEESGIPEATHNTTPSLTNSFPSLSSLSQIVALASICVIIVSVLIIKNKRLS